MESKGDLEAGPHGIAMSAPFGEKTFWKPTIAVGLFYLGVGKSFCNAQGAPELSLAFQRRRGAWGALSARGCRTYDDCCSNHSEQLATKLLVAIVV